MWVICRSGLIFLCNLSILCLPVFGGAQEGVGAGKSMRIDPPDGYTVGQVVLSPDERRTVFSAVKNGRWYLFEGNSKSKPYDSVKMIAFSPDGRRIAYSAGKGSREILVVDGQEIRSHDWVCNPVFSPDSRIVAYEAREGDEYFVVVNGNESPRHGMSLIQPFFSRDSSRIFFILRDRKADLDIRFVSDARSGKVIRTKAHGSIRGVVFSPDGSRYAYAAGREGKQALVVGGLDGSASEDRESTTFNSVHDIVFVEDGSLISFVARSEDREMVVMLDAELTKQRLFPVYDRISKLHFSPDGKHIFYEVWSGTEMLTRAEEVVFIE